MGLEEQTNKAATAYLMRKTDGTNWPLYWFGVDTESRVICVELIFNLGAHQVYIRLPDCNTILSYRRGRTHKLPAGQYAGMDAVAYIDARKRTAGPEDDSPEFQSSEPEPVSLKDISDVIVRDAFSEGNTAQTLFDRYRLTSTSGM